MSKTLAFDLKLPNGELKNVQLQTPKLRKMPDFLIDVFNFLTNLTTSLFFIFVFISHVFNFSVISEVDFVIVIYTFVILMAFFQLGKLILGGDKFFPKVGYDLFVLLLPPFLILPLVFSDNLNLGMFGTLDTWNSAGITLLSVIIYSYILAINFSYKRGFNNIQFWFEMGLLVAGIFRFINPSIVVPDVDILIVLLLPVFIFRFIKHESLRIKFTSFILSILGLFIVITQGFLNINLIDFNWSLQHVFFIFNALILLVLIYKLVANRKKIIKSIAKFSNNSTLEISIPDVSFTSLSFILKSLVVMFFIGSGFSLIRSGFLTASLEGFRIGIVDTFSNTDVREIFLGRGVSLEDSYFINILDAYGIIGFGVFILSISVIVFNELKKLSKSFDVNRLSFILAQSVIIITGLFFQLTTLMVFVQFTFIAFSMINSRAAESDFERFTYLKIKGIKDKRIKIFLNILKFILILLAFIGVIIIIGSLTNIIGKNLR